MAPGGWELVGLLWVAFFLNQADRQVFNVVLPLIRADLGISDRAMGLVATTFTIVYGVLVPVAGFAGDVVDRRRVVWFSLVVFSTGTLLTGFAGGFVLLLLFRGVATGAGEAFYAPAAASLIGSAHGATRARALSIHQTANYTGIVLGSLVAGWVAQRFGWRAAFLVYGVAGLAWAFIFIRRSERLHLPAPAPTTRGEQRQLFREALTLMFSTPILLAQMLAFGGLIFMLVGFLTWGPTLLFERFGLPITQAGFFSVLYHHLLAYAAVIGTSWATDRWAPRWPRIRLIAMAVGLLGSAPCIWWAASAGSLWQIYAALAAFGLFRGMYDAGIFAALFDTVEDRLRATLTGLLLASGFLIGAASPLIMGMMKASYGLEGGMRMLAGVAAFSGLMLLSASLVFRLSGRVA